MTIDSLKKARFLNNNSLKLLAAAAMLIDHMGLIFFPFTMWLRVIGRLAMPLFAFCIAEGCRYTKNKKKYFGMLFGLGAICQAVYFLLDPNTIYFGILISFSLSILNIYALQFAKSSLFSENKKVLQKVIAWIPFVALMAGTWTFCHFFDVDYGYYGCMIPVFASIFDFHRIPAPKEIKKLDVLPMRILCMAIPMTFIVFTHDFRILMAHAYLTLPILLLYNGKRGKRKMKYFFYLFYPLHLVVLYIIYAILYFL